MTEPFFDMTPRPPRRRPPWRTPLLLALFLALLAMQAWVHTQVLP